AIAEPATTSGVVATATFHTRWRKILGMSAALRNVGNILAWTMHGLPPFAIALLSSFYACADPILVTRDAKVSRRPVLFDGQPALEGAFAAQARQAAPARPLGNYIRPKLPLRSPESGHQGVRPQHALHLWPRARGTGARSQRLSGRNLQRGLSQ